VGTSIEQQAAKLKVQVMRCSCSSHPAMGSSRLYTLALTAACMLYYTSSTNLYSILGVPCQYYNI
jgi:hypothetical protein